MNKGFTLAEILVVMAITAIVGTILVVIFTNTLRGSNKAQILAVIKQNGQAVLENMDKTIRDADYVLCGDGNTEVVVKDSVYTRYRFIAPGSATRCGTANGCIAQDYPKRQADANGELETEAYFSHIVCDQNDPMPRLAGETFNILTDTNTQTGVSVECPTANCSAPVFTRNRSEGYKDQVTVKFNMKPGVNAPSIIISQIDPVVFQTTIGLR